MSCEHCRQSDESLCASASLSGYTVDGSFQQYAVAKAAHIARLPADCDLAGVAPILCAGLTVYKALKASGARPGQQVAIAGAGGGLGVFALQYARAMGLHPIAIDAGAAKGEVCRRLGAQAFVDFTKPGTDVVEEVRRATEGGHGPDAVLLLAASERPFAQASRYVKRKGTIVCVGLPADAYIKAPVFDTVVRYVGHYSPFLPPPPPSSQPSIAAAVHDCLCLTSERCSNTDRESVLQRNPGERQLRWKPTRHCGSHRLLPTRADQGAVQVSVSTSSIVLSSTFPGNFIFPHDSIESVLCSLGTNQARNKRQCCAGRNIWAKSGCTDETAC